MADSIPPSPDPDQAWKALTLVNDWIKHADAKVAATLAATAATALALFNLIKSANAPGLTFILAAVACATLLFWTARCALQALVPRVRTAKKSEPEKLDNLLFYRHIANGHAKGTYANALAALTMDSQSLTKHIAEQVHANAGVADTKYVWVDKAINALALALGFLAVVAVASIWK